MPIRRGPAIKKSLEPEDRRTYLRRTLENAAKVVRDIEKEERDERMKRRQPYRTSDHESFETMPESCPLLTTILDKHLNVLIENGSWTTPDKESLFNDIYKQITRPFRAALEQALEDKHALLTYLNGHARKLQSELEKVTRYPAHETERARREPLEDTDPPYEEITPDATSDEDEGP